MLWEHKPIAECFHSFSEFYQTFTLVLLYLNRNLEGLFSISFRKHYEETK